MKQYKSKIIASPGYYLKSSNGLVGYSLAFDIECEYTEHQLTDAVINRPNGSISYGGIFNIKPNNDILLKMIKSIWSNEDLISIILHKDNSSEELEMFEFMKSWLDWFAKKSKLILFLKDIAANFIEIPELSTISINTDTFTGDSIIRVTSSITIETVEAITHKVILDVNPGISVIVPNDLVMSGEVSVDLRRLYIFKNGTLEVDSL